MKQITKFKQTEIGKIPEDWEVNLFSKVCEKIIDCSHAIKPEFLDEGDHIFLEVGNIGRDGFLDLKDVKRISKENYLAWTKRLIPQKDDIVITKTGRVGASAIIPPEIKICIGRNQVILRVDKKSMESHYMWHYLDSSLFKGELKKVTMTGTILESLHVKYISQLKIPTPSLEEQKKIAQFLDSISYKIKLNNKMNETLESIGQAIFKKWFVDEKKEDWKIGKLGDITENIKESLRAGEEIKNRKYVPINLLGMKKLSLDSFLPYTEAKSSLIGFKQDDILLGAMRVYFHRVNIAPFLGVTRGTTFVLRPKEKYFLSYVLFLINQNETINYANLHSKGSTMPYAVWNNSLENMPCQIPPKEKLEEFHELVYPMLCKIRDSLFQNQNLSQIRDILLPKLMSGEVRVK